MAACSMSEAHYPPADKRWISLWLILLMSGVAGFDSALAQDQVSTSQIERGRYLVRTSGCNDCHTPGYPESAGQVDEQDWLTGSDLGWRGPWGTTYAGNLRQVVQHLDEQRWLSHARTVWRPPMPWFNLRDMSDADLSAIYRYIRHLGAAGEAVPAYVPPGQEPKTAYVQFPPGP